MASNYKPPSITTFDDATGVNMCILGAGALTSYVEKRHPSINVIGKDTETDSIHSMKAGECSIVATNLATFQLQERLQETNGDCNLYHDGRIQVVSP